MGRGGPGSPELCSRGVTTRAHVRPRDRLVPAPWPCRPRAIEPKRPGRRPPPSSSSSSSRAGTSPLLPVYPSAVPSLSAPTEGRRTAAAQCHTVRTCMHSRWPPLNANDTRRRASNPSELGTTGRDHGDEPPPGVRAPGSSTAPAGRHGGPYVPAGSALKRGHHSPDGPARRARARSKEIRFPPRATPAYPFELSWPRLLAGSKLFPRPSPHDDGFGSTQIFK